MNINVKRARGQALCALVSILILTGCADAGIGSNSASQAAETNTAVSFTVDGAPELRVTGPWPVNEVVDGDTIWVEGATGREKIRFIGMDTPETKHPTKPVECYGPQASERLRELLEGESIYLQADPTQGMQDTYGRTLAYVWRSDGLLTNLEMVREGYAREYTYDDAYAYQDAFRTAQSSAQSEANGLWGACP
jgi:micrococcal nuclease